MNHENEKDDGLDALDQKVDRALRTALQPEQPPSGFADRVEARLRMEKRGMEKRTGFPQLQPKTKQGWRVISARARESFVKAAILLLAITVPLGWRLHRQSETARGELAKQQVMLALRITGTQLRSIEQRTQSINTGGLPEGDSQ